MTERVAAKGNWGFWYYLLLSIASAETVGGRRHVQTVTQPDPGGPAIGFAIQWAIRDDGLITGGYLDRRVHRSGGAVFAYRRNADGQLEPVQDILTAEQVRLRITVDIAGETLVVGAPLASRGEEFQGVVRFYNFDGDGELTIFDFLAFQTAFDAGGG